MNHFLQQYKFEPTQLNKVRWFRFVEDIGILSSTLALVCMICVGALIPTLTLDSKIVFFATVIMTIGLLFATYGLLGLWIWRRHIRRVLTQKK